MGPPGIPMVAALKTNRRSFLSTALDHHRLESRCLGLFIVFFHRGVD